MEIYEIDAQNRITIYLSQDKQHHSIDWPIYQDSTCDKVTLDSQNTAVMINNLRTFLVLCASMSVLIALEHKYTDN